MSTEPAEVSVLFVDDDPFVRKSVLSLLEGSGLEVLVAEGGRQALQVLASRPVDVLVADLTMPGMDGLTLLGHARRDFPATLRMVLSGSTTLDATLQAVNAGEVVRIFMKPFDPVRFTESMTALAARIFHQREENAYGARKSRSDALVQSLAEHDSTLLSPVAHGERGEITIDLDRLRDAVSPLGPAFVKLLAVERALRN